MGRSISLQADHIIMPFPSYDGHTVALLVLAVFTEGIKRDNVVRGNLNWIFPMHSEEEGPTIESIVECCNELKALNFVVEEFLSDSSKKGLAVNLKLKDKLKS